MRIDHLVYYSADLAAASQRFAEVMDWPPAYGGVHPGEGTANCVLSLSDETYLEILGRDTAQPESSLDGEVAGLNGAGLYHWAIGGVDLPALRSAALAAGLPVGEIISGGRTLPNGDWLGWSVLGLKDHAYGALVPFFIDWGGSQHPARSAPRGGEFSGLEIFSPDASGLARLFATLGLNLVVTPREQPGLDMTVKSGKGTERLTMFQPVPRGYVI